jgi:alpha-galactosidase/6-phospho-beta-glucosidase family protein
MPNVKVAVIGAASYVFGAGVLEQALVDGRMEGLDLALMDIDEEGVELMAALGSRLADEFGLQTNVSAHTDRAVALDGADFVLCAAAVQMQKRHAMDCEIIDRHTPDHHVTEFGGISGISYSLRQIAFLTDLARAMKRHCPQAWLFSSCNPLPRVCQAAHETGIRTAGFCLASISAYESLWRIYEGESIAYPYTPARRRWEADLAGVNHFSWVLAVRDLATGEDLTEEIPTRLAQGASSGQPRSDQLARETGYLPAPHAAHYADFIAPQGPPPPRGDQWHGTTTERIERRELMQEIAAGREHWGPVFDRTSWERPMDVVAAMAFDRPDDVIAQNLVNEGQIANLPMGVFVETPCRVDSQGFHPLQLTLPDAVQRYCEPAARVTDTIVRAAQKRSRKLVHEAVELDPTVVDKSAGLRAIDECLEAHEDLIGPMGT